MLLIINNPFCLAPDAKVRAQRPESADPKKPET